MLLALLGTLSLFSPPSPPRWCGAAGAAITTIERLKNALGASDAYRERLYGLPRLPADSVVRVTDERVCERAVRAYYRHVLGPIPSDVVAVVRVGSRYAVYGTRRAGEWTLLEIYTDRFEPVAGVLQ